MYLSYSVSFIALRTWIPRQAFFNTNSMNSSARRWTEMNRILQSFERENVFKKKRTKQNTKCMYELWSYDITEDMISARLFAITSYSIIANRSLSRSIRNERRVIGRSTDETKRDEVITCEAAVPRMLHRFFFNLIAIWYVSSSPNVPCHAHFLCPPLWLWWLSRDTRWYGWKVCSSKVAQKKKKVKDKSKEEEREDTSCEILIEGESKVKVHRMFCSIA